MEGYKKVDLETLQDNPFTLIGKEWMLVTAGEKDNWNTMTASWGGVGILFNKKVAFVFIRPSRYTYDFSEKYSEMTLTFFEEEHREALKFCGTKSGRDYDKAAETGLIPVETDRNNVAFSQARMIFDCRKITYMDISPEKFIDPIIHDSYPDKSYHRMYIVEIEDCYIKE